MLCRPATSHESAFSASPRLCGGFLFFQFGRFLATGVLGKPDFGLLGWNFGASGNFF
jgi:hypothetical protein